MIWTVGKNNRRIRESESDVEVIYSAVEYSAGRHRLLSGVCHVVPEDFMGVSLRHFILDWIELNSI